MTYHSLGSCRYSEDTGIKNLRSSAFRFLEYPQDNNIRFGDVHDNFKCQNLEGTKVKTSGLVDLGRAKHVLT